MPIGRPEDATYLVKFACGCTAFVVRGGVLWRTRGFAPICEHAAAN